MGFQKTLEYTMHQYSIEPWDTKGILAEKLQRQQELSKNSGLRFINVGDGLAYYGKHCGGWIQQLTREKFVQLSMQLFRERGVMCAPDEARMFYDIFDSIDLYKNATLSIGELAGGLTSFFGGSLENRTHAVFDLLDTHRNGRITKQSLQEFLKPYVWCMVPHDVLRPMFYTHVTNEIAAEITGYDGISRDELMRWMRRNYTSEAFITQNVPYSNVIVERAATIIERAVKLAHHEVSQTRQLRSYGQETWEQSHPGQKQYITDVGVYRYAANAAPTASQTTVTPSAVAQPTLWSSVSLMTSQMTQQAGGYFNTLMGTEEGATVTPAASMKSTSFIVSPSPEVAPPEPPRPVQPQAATHTYMQATPAGQYAGAHLQPQQKSTMQTMMPQVMQPAGQAVRMQMPATAGAQMYSFSQPTVSYRR